MKKIVLLSFSFILQGQATLPVPIPTTSSETCVVEPLAFHCVKLNDTYDGDTFKVDLTGVHPFFGKKTSVRIYGIDAPEMHSHDKCEKQKALEAKKALSDILTKAKKIDLLDIKKDKYFRVLAHVFADGQDVAKIMLDKKLVRPYFGDTKSKASWCGK